MRTYIVSIMGLKGIFKKEVKAHHYKCNRLRQLTFYARDYSADGFCVINSWVLVEEVTSEL